MKSIKSLFISKHHICFVLGLAMSGAATAQSAAWSDFADAPTRAYAQIGTQGLGVGVAKPLNRSVDLRLGASTLNYGTTGAGESLNTDAQIKLHNLGLYADWFPSENSGFRLTAGVQAGRNKVNLTAKPNTANTININGTVYGYTPADSISGNLNMGNAAPYLGLGWSQHGPNKTGLSFNFDLGVRFGKADVSLTRSGFGGLTAAQQTQLDADMRAEERKLADDLKVLKTYPVIALGLSYRW